MHGTSRDYLLRRLQRDCPETFAAFQRGELRSVRHAAVTAGLLPRFEEYVRRTLADRGRVSLLRAVERGELTERQAALRAGLIRGQSRRPQRFHV
jgi:hypothetical protein